LVKNKEGPQVYGRTARNQYLEQPGSFYQKSGLEDKQDLTVKTVACTNVAGPVWTPLQSVTLTNGSIYFSDPQWTNYAARYYGLGFP
jgi:hypothetical protein